ncbi:hypothetical protein TSOC_002280 [Tetrabaena socialis]|uniref:Uncharacterized protein n=1 Tax=Tetrabaena socialis TaxID=47790 RepID=A0A2J8AEK4_9CHLO|nr:hypothetical protein TSOC_002280 [Tetrabaena socialis]|eukprot:PNH10948.1 hypothetical protein TSOC_002280 [Tetrabaena socialis]
MKTFTFSEFPIFKSDAKASFSRLRSRLKLGELEVPVREAYLLLDQFPLPESTFEVWWLGEKRSIISDAATWHLDRQADEGIAAADASPLEGNALVEFYLYKLQSYFAPDRKMAKHLEFKLLAQRANAPSLFLQHLRLLEKDLDGSESLESFAKAFLDGLDPAVKGRVLAKYELTPRHQWYAQLSSMAADADTIWNNLKHDKVDEQARSGAKKDKPEKQHKAEEEVPSSSYSSSPPSRTDRYSGGYTTGMCDLHGPGHNTANCRVLNQAKAEGRPPPMRPDSPRAMADSTAAALLSKLLASMQVSDEIRSVMASSDAGRPRHDPESQCSNTGSSGLPNCSYCAKPGHNTDNCLVKYPDRASEGWLPQEEGLKRLFLSNKGEQEASKRQAPTEKRRAAAATAKAQESEGESSDEDDYQSIRSAAHVSYAMASSSSQQIPSQEIPALLDRRPETAQYFKDKHFMFYFPLGAIAFKGHWGKLVTLRDHCANVNLIGRSTATRLGLRHRTTKTLLSTSAENNHKVLGELDCDDLWLSILPPTAHEVPLRATQTLLVEDNPLFDLLGNEQMRPVADSLSQHPKAQIHLYPNLLEAPDYIISLAMSKGPETMSALATRGSGEG